MAHATFTAMRRIRGVLLDVLVAFPFLVVGQLTAWGVIADGGTRFQGSHPVNAALAVLFDGLIVLRRRAPLVALALMLPIGIAETAHAGASAFFSGFVPVVLLVCSAAMRAPRRWSLAAMLWALGGLIAIIAIAPDLKMTNELPFSGPIVVLAGRSAATCAHATSAHTRPRRKQRRSLRQARACSKRNERGLHANCTM